MKLTSNWSNGRIFWRTFDKGDTLYAVGLREGLLSNGQSVDYNHPTGSFQMEIKRGDIFGSHLVTPGEIFNNDDELILQSNGTLARIEDIANVVLDPTFKFEPYGTVIQFFLAGSADSIIKIVSSLTQTTTVSNTKQTTISNSATTETGVQVGGEVSGKGKVGEVEVGVKINPSVSHKVINKIERVIVSSLGIQVITSTSYSEDQNITLKAGKFTTLITNWQRRFVTGNLIIGNNPSPFEATLGYITSRQQFEYASPSDLPPHLMAEYMKQNPGYQPGSSPARLSTKIIGLAGKCIDVRGSQSSNGASIILHELQGGLSQQWLLTPEGFIVSSLDTNKCLDIAGGVPNDGTPIILFDKHGGNNQRWRHDTDGCLTSFLSSNKCIDVRGAVSDNGTPIILWEKNGGRNQQWRFE